MLWAKCTCDWQDVCLHLSEGSQTPQEQKLKAHKIRCACAYKDTKNKDVIYDGKPNKTTSTLGNRWCASCQIQKSLPVKIVDGVVLEDLHLLECK